MIYKLWKCLCSVGCKIDRKLCTSLAPGWLRNRWRSLWIRKGEFHPSLDIDTCYASTLEDETARQKYYEDLMARRDADVSLEIVRERNLARDRVVPEHAMEGMRQMLLDVPPEIADGFDSLFFIDEFQKLKQAEICGEHKISKEFKIR